MLLLTPVDRRRQRGFTLLELLVVIAILGLLAALVAPRVMTLFGNAKQKIAAQSIGQLVDVLEFYRLDVGNYPSTDQGLDALVTAPSGAANWHGPYLKDGKAPVDPWGRPFQYRNPAAAPASRSTSAAMVHRASPAAAARMRPCATVNNPKTLDVWTKCPYVYLC